MRAFMAALAAIAMVVLAATPVAGQGNYTVSLGLGETRVLLPEEYWNFVYLGTEAWPSP